jgi:Domain of unknown function (DUF3943)
MGQSVRLVTTLFAIVLMSAVHLPVAADHDLTTATGEKLRPERVRQPMRSTPVESPVSQAGDPDVVGQRTHHPRAFPPAVEVDVEAQPTAQMGLSSWHQPDGLMRFSFFPKTPVAEREGGAEDPLLTHDEPDVADDGNAAPSALGPDWRGLGRDTTSFLGYQGVVAGILYLLPEDVTKWTAEQRKTSMRRWWENMQHPTWDEDNWYVNYLGHPYFGAIAYIRARERRFGAFGAFWYAALLSGLYEFGIEALFERPSYQDLIVTPMAGTLLGALLFEPIREHIQGKPERQWYDHLTLALTDPLGTAYSMFGRLLGIQTEIRIHVHAPTRAPPAPFSEPTAGSLNRPQEKHYRFYGIGIAFVF